MHCNLSCKIASATMVLASMALAALTACGGGNTTPLPTTAPPTPTPPPPPPQAAGTFTPTGNMTIARAGHSATLLPDGRVLIVGGRSCVNCTDDAAEHSAELYDPIAGTFTSANDMITSRGGHSAILLPGGKVLIVGGIVLQDGRTLIVKNDNAEIYDPASDTFALTAPYGSPAGPGPILVDSATLLSDGKVLVTGCAVQCSDGVTELYDPKTGTFSLKDPTLLWGTVITATLLMDGKVLLVAGGDNGSPDVAEVYDPATGTFTRVGDTSQVHEFSAAVRLADGTVLIAGGQLPGGNGNPGTELYLPATWTFAFAGNMTTGRHSNTASLLLDGTVLIAGGYSKWPTPTSSAEIYKPPAVQ